MSDATDDVTRGPGRTVGPAADRVHTEAAIAATIAEELAVAPRQVTAAVELLDGGATVPFVARYRKETTGGLDDAQLRTLAERLVYLRELEGRRAAILASIDERGALTPKLRASILAADTKARLEDIYLPYKPKRRTKAQIAREAGLEPLADLLLGDPDRVPEDEAVAFLRSPDEDGEGGVADVRAALDGARAILVERFAEDADLVGELRELLWRRGRIVTEVKTGRETDGAKFADYFEFSEPLARIPGHRILAVLRGEKEGVLSVTVDPEPDADAAATGMRGVYEERIAAHAGIRDAGRPGDRWLADTVRWAWRTKLLVGGSVDARLRLRTRAEEEAVAVFATNLRDLLLAAPAGPRATLGLDPGYRTGVKVAVVDATGKVVDTAVIHPHKPADRWDESLAVLSALVVRHGVELVAVGNGTASRETDRLAGELVALCAPTRSLTKVVVSEAGASVYSASEYASRELPGMDVSLRGAVSIARRLQDPLAELVKIEPRSIGVGQYQHDVSESLLARSLDAVVEDAVNAVGVDLNTASVPLLARVSGVTPTLAENIVAYRDGNGRFRRRSDLTKVSRLGPKAYELCAGFLRIRDGDDPLDASAVHPESYPVVRRILDATSLDLEGLIGNDRVLGTLRPADFADDRFGVPTVSDILAELDKPGRDPRPEFRTAGFADGIEKVSDLRPGMILEGVVTNVAAFGAFVDVGVHQDGLVHVSAMRHGFVSDPHDVVRSGDVVKVKVMGVDVDRQRIGLSLRLDDEPEGDGNRGGRRSGDAEPAGRRGGNGGSGGRGGEARGSGGRGSGGRGSGGRESVGRGGDRRGSAHRRQSAPTGSMADALRKAGFGR